MKISSSHTYLLNKGKKKDVPGPGEYFLGLVKEPKKESKGSKSKRFVQKDNGVPPCNIYHLGKSHFGKDVPKCTLYVHDNVTYTSRVVKSKQNVPGPGSYIKLDTSKTPITKRNVTPLSISNKNNKRTYTTFGVGDRFKTINNNNTPGPGEYLLNKSFDMVNTSNKKRTKRTR
jgi:hypothetical protein